MPNSAASSSRGGGVSRGLFSFANLDVVVLITSGYLPDLEAVALRNELSGSMMAEGRVGILATNKQALTFIGKTTQS